MLSIIINDIIIDILATLNKERYERKTFDGNKNVLLSINCLHIHWICLSTLHLFELSKSEHNWKYISSISTISDLRNTNTFLMKSYNCEVNIYKLNLSLNKFSKIIIATNNWCHFYPKYNGSFWNSNNFRVIKFRWICWIPSEKKRKEYFFILFSNCFTKTFEMRDNPSQINIISRTNIQNCLWITLTTKKF